MSDRAEFVCPKCHGVVMAPVALAGEAADCPKCGQEVDSWPTPKTLSVSPSSPKASRSAVWHYSVDGRQRGPVADSQLRALVEAGMLRPTDLVWRDGMSEWVEARMLKALFSASEGEARPPALPQSRREDVLDDDEDVKPRRRRRRDDDDYDERPVARDRRSRPSRRRDEDDEEEDDRPRRRRRSRDEAEQDSTGDGVALALLILATLFIPLVGLVVGGLNLANESPRKRMHGGILLGFALFMVLVYIASLDARR